MPLPGEYKVLKKIVITQNATRYTENYSTGKYTEPGEIIFIRAVKKLETINGILYRGKIDFDSWVTIYDAPNDINFLEFKVTDFKMHF
jgi:hypothetical protein